MPLVVDASFLLAIALSEGAPTRIGHPFDIRRYRGQPQLKENGPLALLLTVRLIGGIANRRNADTLAAVDHEMLGPNPVYHAFRR